MGYMIKSAITGNDIMKCESAENANKEIEKLNQNALKDMITIGLEWCDIDNFYICEKINA